MNDDIIRMARKADEYADMEWPLRPRGDRWRQCRDEHFAELVAAAKEAEHKEAMRWDVHSCGPTCKRYACVAIREAVEAERERICKAIKEEDDYCVTEGDYMLDSDNCIAVAKGEWARPDFSVPAVSAKRVKS